MLSSEESEKREVREKFTVERLLPDQQSSESDGGFFGPVLPPHLLKKGIEGSDGGEKVYGPVLPDHLSIKKDGSLEENSSERNEVLIGPALPEEFRRDLSVTEGEGTLPSDSTDDGFGPSTDLMANGDVTTSSNFTNVETFTKKIAKNSSAKRETWMIELPEKRGANFGLLPRHFRSRLQADKDSDGSAWTETPDDRNRKQKSKKDHKEILKMRRLQERDKQMEKLAKKAAKKLRKKKSLLEMHLKSMKKKKEKERKKEEKKGKAAVERRPFDRNVDLQVHRFDENQTRSIINKSQFLNCRFAPGQSKFL